MTSSTGGRKVGAAGRKADSEEALREQIEDLQNELKLRDQEYAE